MADVKSINGNPIVLDSVAPNSITDTMLAQTDGVLSRATQSSVRPKMVLGYTISSGGTISSYRYSALSMRIAVSAGSIITNYGPAQDGDGVGLSVYVAEFSGTTFLSRDIVAHDGQWVVTENADNVIILFTHASSVDFDITQAYVDTYFDVIVSVECASEGSVSRTKSYFVSDIIDITKEDTEFGKGYSGTSGNIVSSSSYNITDYIPCFRGVGITAYSFPPDSYNDGKTQPTFTYVNSDVEFAKVGIYDAQKNWLRTENRSTSANQAATIYPDVDGYIRVQHLKRNAIQVLTEGIAADMVAHRPDVVDLFIFMGQSNMGGRGETSTAWPQTAPNVIPGAGWEFRAISDPTCLRLMREPFGYYENVTGAIDDGTRKTGGCVVSFTNEYYTHNGGVPIVGVSASEGGTTISNWQPSGARLTDAISRLTAAVTWLESNGYTIRHKFMCWCQGESDGDSGTTKANYITGFNAMFGAMKSAGIEKCFLFRIGEYNGTSSTDYSTIIEAQTEICQTDADVIMVTANQASYKTRGLMKDAFHYYQAAYNEMGEYAGINAAMYVETGKEPTMYDTKSGELYYSHVN